MAVKLFIVGLPGSGKSEVARNIGDYTRKKGWATKRFNDYRILNAMFRYNKQGWFKPAQPRGFNVVDITAFDFALSRLERKIARYNSSINASMEEIVLIEFARNDYWRAFKQFNPSFLKDAYFIYLGAEVGICKKRINDRVAEQKYPVDDYPVSDYIFEKYYYGDDGWDLTSNFRNIFGINEKRLLIHNNNSSLEETMKKIVPFIDGIIKIESVRFSAIQKQTDHSEMFSVHETEESSNSIESSEPNIKIEGALVPG